MYIITSFFQLTYRSAFAFFIYLTKGKYNEEQRKKYTSTIETSFFNGVMPPIYMSICLILGSIIGRLFFSPYLGDNDNQVIIGIASIAIALGLSFLFNRKLKVIINQKNYTEVEDAVIALNKSRVNTLCLIYLMIRVLPWMLFLAIVVLTSMFLSSKLFS